MENQSRDKLSPEQIKESEKEQKLARLRELLHGEPEVIFVLSGGIKKLEHPVNGQVDFKTTSYQDRDSHGTLGGHARILAAAEITTAFPNMKVVTTSRVETNFPSHAQVMADELKRKGVNPNNIMLEELSNSTLTELLQMTRMSVEHRWNTIAVLSSNYHLPRVKELYSNIGTLTSQQDTRNYVQQFQQNNPSVTFVGAEDILPLRSNHYNHLINQIERTAAYQDRLQAEAQGVKQLQERTYNFTQWERKPEK